MGLEACVPERPGWTRNQPLLGRLKAVEESEAGSVGRHATTRPWRSPAEGARRAGMVAISALSTEFTDSALLKTRATSGSSRTATAPDCTLAANRLGLAFE